MAPVKDILVIGAGELGDQVLRFLAKDPRRQEANVSVLLRPASIDSTSAEKKNKLDGFHKLGIQVVPADVVQDSEQDLAAIFSRYDTVISCMGFVSGKGTQVKLTQAVLSARTSRFIPWQFGVDYDIIGRGSAQDLFDEQLDVRDLLRAQKKTSWAIISTGMFTSFLFEPFFGVVDTKEGTVCALGSWENRVTLTTPEDIGRITAELVLTEAKENTFSNKPIFIGGDTISYGDLAELVEKVTGKSVKRSVLTVEAAQEALAKDPTNHLLKYQIVFGQGRGVAWNLTETWNIQKNIPLTTAAEWAATNLV
ncbi:isoflavone reductase family protein [Talaromyces proteolyticus]|uniref:Isoflavone reductase family protein n=1 Tax=Talaromyces proteolyticus TaxID=1131652 RepID=A0AAD4PX01_9EURO|nr:isoflavone reductase family protein [Talaromyces proteolyticus]KAH8698772.1 isoflavone reductase family protein [Talaromyces proteolyticus]